MSVVVAQPIAESGLSLLRDAGLSVHVADAPTFAAMRPHLGEARAIITRNAGLTREAIDAAPRLRVIGSHGTGVDSIDRAAAAERGIAVINTPGVNAGAVAELTLALMFACARGLHAADGAVRAGDFDYRHRQRSIELAGRTLGIVGFGHVARRVAELARALGMEVAAWSRRADRAAMGVAMIDDLDELCARADILSLHASGGATLLDAGRIARMKPGAILINTARAGLVDRAALVRALRDNRIAAAGIDVFAPEPPAADDPLLTAPNVMLSPHIGGSTVEALDRTARAVAEDVLRVLRGEPPRHPVPWTGL